MLKIYDYRDKLRDEDRVRDIYLNNFGELNLDFLRVNADRFTYEEWCYISYFANLTKEFVEEFSHELEMSLFFENNYTSLYVKNSFRSNYVSGSRRGYHVEPVEEKLIKSNRNILFVLAEEVVKK